MKAFTIALIALMAIAGASAQSAAADAGASVGAAVGGATGSVSGTVNAVANDPLATLSGLITNILTTLLTILTQITAITGNTTATINGAFSGLVLAAFNQLTSAVNAVAGNALSGTLDGISVTLKQLLAGVINAATPIAQLIIDNATKSVNELIATFTALASTVSGGGLDATAVNNAIATLSNLAPGLLSSVLGPVGDAVIALFGLIKNVLQGIVAVLSNLTTSVTSVKSGLLAVVNVTAALAGAATGLLNTGLGLIANFGNVDTAISAFVSAISVITSQVSGIDASLSASAGTTV